MSKTKTARKNTGGKPVHTKHPRGKRYLVITAKGKKVLRWEDEL